MEVIEGYIQDFAINGNTTINISNLDSDYKLYFTESMIAQNGIFINSDKDSFYWRAVDNLESTQLGQKVFKFGLMPVTNTCYIEFPQDAAALFGDGIHIKYIVTQGVDGNISSGVLNSISNTLENNDIKELDSEGNPTDTKADLKKYTLWEVLMCKAMNLQAIYMECIFLLYLMLHSDIRIPNTSSVLSRMNHIQFTICLLKKETHF